jgi:hypothetical protein
MAARRADDVVIAMSGTSSSTGVPSIPAGPPASFFTEAELLAMLGVTAALAPDVLLRINMAAAGITQAIRTATGRQLSAATYADTFARYDSFSSDTPWATSHFTPTDALPLSPRLTLTEPPVQRITGVRIDGTDFAPAIVRLNHVTGSIHPVSGTWGNAREVVVGYVGGFQPFPADLAMVFNDLFSRQIAAWSLDLGGATVATGDVVKAVQIGTLRVDYATPSQSQGSASGTAPPLSEQALGDYAPILGAYRSHRMLIGTGL